MKFFLKKYTKKISLFHHYYIIFGSTFLFFAFIIFNFKHRLKSNDIFPSQRKLSSGYEKQKTEEICQKADKDLIELYKTDSDFNIKDNTQIDTSTSYLLKYIEDGDNDQLKQYIFTFYPQMILAILDIFSIALWIFLCYCLCKDNFMKSYLKLRFGKKCLKNIIFLISFLMYLGIIIVNIIILFKLRNFLNDINNSFCSLFKISYHTYNGEEKFYEMKPKWTGINKIKNLLQKTKENLGELTNQNNQINQKINEIKENKYYNQDNNNFIQNYINEFCDLNTYSVPNPNPFISNKISEFLYCSDILNLVEKEYKETFTSYLSEINDIFNILKSINDNTYKIEFAFDNAKNKLDSFVKIIKQLEVDYFNNLVHIFEEIIRRYLIYIIYIFFVLVLLLEIAGFISIIVLKRCYSLSCIRAYNCMWNFQFLSAFLIILFCIFLSSMKVFIGDISSIMKSLKNKETKIKLSNNDYDMEGINTCLKGNEDLAHYMELDKDAEPISHFYSMINNIKYNLNYIKNYKLISEKNETINIIDTLKESPFFAKFKQSGDNNYVNSEEIVEKYLNNYTDNEINQDLKDNNYYSHYFFVFDSRYCKSNYQLLSDNNLDNNFYNEGKYCMLIKDFPSNSNYFKSITTKNLENNYTLDDLVTKFKEKYYNSDGFEKSFLNLLHNSKIYLENKIVKESNKIKNGIISLYNILESKINIIHELYKKILKSNSTDLFSAFNCRYLKRDFSIFIDKLDNNLIHSINGLNIYCLILAIFSLISILSSILNMKFNKLERKYKEKLFKKKEISEKPKLRTLRERLNFDENPKSSTNEKTILKKRSSDENAKFSEDEKTTSKKRSKVKHVLDMDIENSK